MLLKNELRPGNFFQDSTGIIFKVVEILNEGICVGTHKVLSTSLDNMDIQTAVDKRTIINYVDAFPLAITKHRLTEFGFIQRGMPFVGTPGYAISGDGYFIGIVNDNDGGKYRFHNPHFDLLIDKFHILQNLCYYLTGIEITNQ